MNKLNKNQQGFHIWVIALIVAVLAGLGFAGWYVWDKNQNQTVEEQASSTTTPTPTPTVSASVTPTPTPDPTADWQTYTNTRYGYSIKYPIDWTFNQNSDESGVSFYKTGLEDAIANIWPPRLYSLMGGIGDKNPSNTSFEDFVTKYWLYPDRNEAIVATEMIQTNSGQAYYISYSGQWFSDIYTRHEAFLKDSSDLVYDFYFYKNASSTEQDILKLFVSTFTLTN